MKKIIFSAIITAVLCTTANVSANSCFTTKGGVITDYSASCGTTVNIPSTINGEEIWGIAPKAFAHKNISSVNFPSTLTDIGDFAFYENNLTTVNIPDGTLYIAPQAFAFNSITSANIPNSVDSISEGAFEGNCISTNSRLDILSAGWKEEQYGCGKNPIIETEQPKPNNPTNTNNSQISGKILFPNFTIKWTPTIISLDDTRLESMKNQFGYDNSKVTRGEFLKIVMDSAKIDLHSVNLEEITKYKDVSQWDKYARYVAYASVNKIVSGYSDGTFGAERTITRDEATKILVQSIGVELANSQTTFKDISPDNTLGIYVQTAYNNKLVNGTSTTTFEPKKTITKWELYKIIYNILN